MRTCQRVLPSVASTVTSPVTSLGRACPPIPRVAHRGLPPPPWRVPSVPGNPAAAGPSACRAASSGVGGLLGRGHVHGLDPGQDLLQHRQPAPHMASLSPVAHGMPGAYDAGRRGGRRRPGRRKEDKKTKEREEEREIIRGERRRKQRGVGEGEVKWEMRQSPAQRQQDRGSCNTRGGRRSSTLLRPRHGTHRGRGRRDGTY